MANRITLSSDDACLVHAILKGELQRLRVLHAAHPGEFDADWLAEVEGACDRLTIKLFGREYLEREKAKATTGGQHHG